MTGWLKTIGQAAVEKNHCIIFIASLALDIPYLTVEDIPVLIFSQPSSCILLVYHIVFSSTIADLF